MSTVGLSMIVLNESVDRLAMLVEYLKPIVSDFVIADTGSGDIDLDEPLYNTWGVKVMRLEWRRDFAWARNETLQHLTTDWVLHLDADELPSRAMMDHIASVTSDQADPLTKGWLYLAKNFWGGELGITVEAHWHCRLFRRDAGRWYKPLHEQVVLDGQKESQTRGTPVLVKAPQEAYLIHSKPREAIERSGVMYKEMEGSA
jgi:glycosyltransferase involved in cell wall biosynthesis